MGMYLTQWATYAEDLGATIIDGINWTWAEGFPTEENAKRFMMAFPEMETRGIYPPSKDGEGWSVRFRY
jgi:hypothetical protein